MLCVLQEGAGLKRKCRVPKALTEKPGASAVGGTGSTSLITGLVEPSPLMGEGGHERGARMPGEGVHEYVEGRDPLSPRSRCSRRPSPTSGLSHYPQIVGELVTTVHYVAVGPLRAVRMWPTVKPKALSVVEAGVASVGPERVEGGPPASRGESVFLNANSPGRGERKVLPESSRKSAEKGKANEESRNGSGVSLSFCRCL